MDSADSASNGFKQEICVSGLTLSLINGAFSVHDSYCINLPDFSDADIHFSVSVGTQHFVLSNVLYRDVHFIWFKHNGGVGIAVYNNDNDLHAVLFEQNAWMEIRILLSSEKNAEYTIKTLSEIAYRNRLLYHGGLVFHASAIRCKGAGVAFTAKAGGGKTTQADLWKSHMNAEVLNADRPAVLIKDGIPLIYGTPWSGSSDENINAHAPLRLIACVQKSQRNFIHELSRKQAVEALLPRIFLPYFDGNLMEIALKNLENILELVPVCILECLPQKESVDLVRKIVYV